MQYKTTLAFPMSALVYNYDDKAPDTIVNEGMTLRDYFAAKAIPALIANFLNTDLDLVDPEGWMDGLAMDAYSMADAMLKAREQ